MTKRRHKTPSGRPRLKFFRRAGSPVYARPPAGRIARGKRAPGGQFAVKLWTYLRDSAAYRPRRAPPAAPLRDTTAVRTPRVRLAPDAGRRRRRPGLSCLRAFCVFVASFVPGCEGAANAFTDNVEAGFREAAEAAELGESVGQR